jgi:amino acid adenylation domain-containing protein
MTIVRLPATTTGLLRWFERGLRLNPDKVAVRSHGRLVSYRELSNEAEGLARAVITACGGPPHRVGVLAARNIRGYAGILGALRCGATVVPLNVDYPAARTRQMMAAARLSALIVDDRGRSLLDGLGDAIDDLHVVDDPAPDGPSPAPAMPGPDEIAYILFTSGSTGRPKGVPITHRNVEHYLRVVGERYGFTADDVFSQTFDLTFDLAMFDMFCAWGAGGTVVSADVGALLALPDFLAASGITVWFSAPSAIGAVRRLGGLAPGGMPTLRWSLFCGEPLLGGDAVDWQAAAANSTVENLYGPTELTISCSVQTWSDAISGDCVNDVVPIGRLHDGLSMVLLNGDRTDPEADEGELCVSGAQTFPGYLDPTDDAGRFVRHWGQRYYRTGDLVRRLPSGDLAYLGRVDHQVNIGGRRIELPEIDFALRRCPGVTEAMTVVSQDTLVAYYSGKLRPAADLRRELGETLPRHMVPRFLEYLETFPLNPNRKIDRKELSRRASVLLNA